MDTYRSNKICNLSEYIKNLEVNSDNIYAIINRLESEIQKLENNNLSEKNKEHFSLKLSEKEKNHLPKLVRKKTV